MTKKISNLEEIIVLPEVCIAILNWKGLQFLKDLLPSVIEASNLYEGRSNIVVLDNNEDDDTDRAWIRENFSEETIHVVQAPANDFLYSYNWLLDKVESEIFILLNNDLRVDRNFIGPLVRHFTNSKVFAVSSLSYDWQGEDIVSGPYLFRQHRGWFYCTPDISRQLPCYTLFACGGFMAVDRRKFLSLGGFHKLFYPAYGEDLDICYRAWCRGWSSIYEPESIVYHFQSGSWNDGHDEKVRCLNLRANFLFQWQHLKSYPFKLFHTFYLVWLYIRKVIQKDKVWLKAHFEAVTVWNKFQQDFPKEKIGKNIKIKSLKRICASGIKDIDLDREIEFL